MYFVVLPGLHNMLWQMLSSLCCLLCFLHVLCCCCGVDDIINQRMRSPAWPLLLTSILLKCMYVCSGAQSLDKYLARFGSDLVLRIVRIRGVKATVKRAECDHVCHRHCCLGEFVCSICAPQTCMGDTQQYGPRHRSPYSLEIHKSKESV